MLVSIAKKNRQLSKAIAKDKSRKSRRFRDSINLAILVFLFAGSVAKPQPWDPKTYENEEFFTDVTNKPIKAIRYLGRDGKLVSTYMTLLSPFVLDKNSAQELLALPPFNNAKYFQIIEIPPNIKYHSGVASGGAWIKEKGLDKWRFIPIQDINNNQVDRIRASGGEVVYRKGGYVQIEINPKDIPRMQLIGERQEIPRNSFHLMRLDSVRHNVSTSTSRSEIQKVINNFGKMPGGILISPKAVIKEKISVVVYDQKNNEFLINGAYKYNPDLDREEVATIANAVYNTSKRSIAALSQSEFVGIPDDSKMARTLSEADVLLGQITYGYDTKGIALSKRYQVTGYRNPLALLLRDFKNQDLPRISREASVELNSLHLRLFLDFKSVLFKLDRNQKTMVPEKVETRIYYQTLRENPNGQTVLMKKNPQYYSPHDVGAINQFKDNYSAYESRYPIYLKIRKFAELQSFLAYLQRNSIPILGRQKLDAEFSSRIKIPVAYIDYAYLLPNSAKRIFYKNAVILLERIETSKLRPKDRFSIYALLYSYSINSNQVSKSQQYIPRILEAFGQLSDQDRLSADTKIDIHAIQKYLDDKSMPVDVLSKVAWSHYYKRSKVRLSRKLHTQAVAWLEQAAQQGLPHYNLITASVYHWFGDQNSARYYLNRYKQLVPNDTRDFRVLFPGLLK
jgi:hypothetical protein